MLPELAPIALFTFKRAKHTERTLRSLAQNPEFVRSPLYIYCDGARHPDEKAAVDATRVVAREWPHPRKQVYEADSNRGLANSIVSGVNQLCSRHGCAIVIEDDLVLSVRFLAYMNEALDRYKSVREVMQVSGHMFPIPPSNTAEAALLRLTTSWGWATWKRAWDHFDASDIQGANSILKSIRQRFAFDFNGAYPFSRMLSDQIAGKNDSWAIWWYLAVYKKNGLGLFPAQSLVLNAGFDGTGTHAGHKGRGDRISAQEIPELFPAEIVENSVVRSLVRRQLIKERGLAAYLKDSYFRFFQNSL
ncbi:MAG: glycosyltransferase family 2 protein [Rubrivivax sp.]|nr:glycosyltransferase family 2 protein [Rubrivivax sp.]